MKKHLYSLLVLLLPAVAWAQPTRPAAHLLGQEQPAGPGALARSATEKQVARTRIVYTWDAATGNWSAQPTKSTITYTSQGYLDRILTVDSATSQAVSRGQYTRNSNGYVTKYLREAWVNGRWQNEVQYVQAYDDKNRYTDFLQQKWTNGAWQNDYQDKQQYDYYGNSTNEHYQVWENNAWQTYYHVRNAYSYNSAGNITEKTVDEWQYGMAADATVPARRYVYTYADATSKNYSEQLYQVWNQNSYADASKIDNIVWDASNRMTSSIGSNWANNTWTPTNRVTTVFGSGSGSSLGYERLTENFLDSQWQNSLRSAQRYDKYNNYLGNTYERWTANAWMQTSGSSYTLAYNSNTDVKASVYKIYQNAQGGFVNQTKTSFKDFAVVTAAASVAALPTSALQVYPNPTSGKVQLSLASWSAKHAPVQGELINSLGKVVQTMQLVPRQGVATHELNLSALTSGVYLLRLRTSEGTVTQRIVRE
ncbi:T9SS type A sorting domain-containing protein [Hymenobacter sp. BT18]|uniref:T9SS type A sorting domain-containing protein n=1 Tax=Hymenobacter sp. BT18 TaxID=2835648 RepID=UPI00143E45F3|nr:T9SS type A sorting domain-containing protein [Hymenobacter sp. BT18]QIX62616.1 T9SS type A sorting domain-containing protein [Hymenobacter sp. BT18]